MDRIGMVGTSFRRGNQGLLSHYTLPNDDLDARLLALHSHCGFIESVYIATCNRVEIIFVGAQGRDIASYRDAIFGFFHPERGQDTLQARQQLHAYGGEGAHEHLFCVAAAIDSMNPGDAQILGQVKDGYLRAQKLGTVGPRLRLVFEEAFEAAKRVRSQTALGTGRVSMFSLALEQVRARLSTAGVLAIVGTGEMSVQCAEAFCGSSVRLLFINRTFDKAAALAKRYGGVAADLETFLHHPMHFDVMVTATGAPTALFSTQFFARLSHPALVVDLAVPRDTDPQVKAPHIEIVDVDCLAGLAARSRQERAAQVAEARVLLDEALAALRRKVIERDMAEVVRSLRAYYDDEMQRALAALLGSLSHLHAGDQERVAAFARRLVNRCAHVPTTGLKKVAHVHGLEPVRDFLSALDDSQRPVKEHNKE